VPVTLTQLGAFVLVARLGSVRAAANALGVSEPAVSQALAALRKHLDDELVVRTSSGMALTAGGQRLLSIASQMVSLGAEAEAAIRTAQGAPELLRVVADSVIAELVAPSLLEAFRNRTGGVETTVGVATTAEMGALLHERMADVALGPNLAGESLPGVESHPVMRCQLVVVAATSRAPAMARVSWLVDSSGTDPSSPVAGLLAAYKVPETRIRVFPSQAAALAAASDGEGVAPVLEHLAAPDVHRGALRRVDAPGTPVPLRWYVSVLSVDRRSPVAGSLRHFLGTPPAMQLMHKPGRGLPPSRFRPPVYVTLWS
jgi:DNA-binding transcriptional LysR family regulator